MSLKGSAGRLLAGLGKLLAALGLLIGAAFGFNFYNAQPVKAFCAELPTTATPEDVLALAAAKGLPAFDVTQARGVVSVLNQRSPFFRYACEVEFKGNVQVGKHVIAAD